MNDHVRSTRLTKLFQLLIGFSYGITISYGIIWYNKWKNRCIISFVLCRFAHSESIYIFHVNYVYMPTTIIWKNNNNNNNNCKGSANVLVNLIRAWVSRWDSEKKNITRAGEPEIKRVKNILHGRAPWFAVTMCNEKRILRPLFVQLVSVLLAPRPPSPPRSSFVGLSTCADSRIYIQMNCRGRVDLSTYQTWRGEE